MNLYPYRSSAKLSYGLQGGLLSIEDALRIQEIPTYQPKYQQKYSIMHVHGKKTWMMDYIFIKGNGEVITKDEEIKDKDNDSVVQSRKLKIILLRLHCNSRYCEADIVPNRRDEIVRPLMLLYIRRGVMDTVITDSEPSFQSESLRRYVYRDGVMKHIVYNMSMPWRDNAFPHTYLALVDRMARTLRDMLFNCQRASAAFVLTNETLQQVLNIYNNTPHATLTKIMGFPVTPANMFKYPILQDEYIRRVMSRNQSLVTSSVYTDVKVGDIVYLHAPRQLFDKRRGSVEDDMYRVIDIQGLAFVLQNTRDPRYIKKVHRGDFIKQS